jgi:UDP-2-acetamido-2,6-beta-L-arabino-hexul-4-ose reductase
MKTVLVTGASGFIGKNLCAQLRLNEEITVLTFTRDNTLDELEELMPKVDFIFHVAGVNRPKDDSEFATGNPGLTEALLDCINKSGKKIPVLITSSIHAAADTPYGSSKKAAEDIVFAWQKETDNKAYVFRLPNVFGKWGRPNYNSAITTFCRNIATGQEITVNDPSVQLTLVYIDDVVRAFVKAMDDQITADDEGFCKVSRTFTVTLGDIVDTLYAFKESRNSLIMPSLENPFDRFLYATFTSYFDEDAFSYKLEKKSDDRGWLAEFIKSKQFGQIFISRTKPGISRGNHWHHTKIEKFLVIEGQADIKFRLLDSDKVITYSVSGDDLEVLDIPAGYIHSITNTGKNDLLTLFWADEL